LLRPPGQDERRNGKERRPNRNAPLAAGAQCSSQRKPSASKTSTSGRNARRPQRDSPTLVANGHERPKHGRSAFDGTGARAPARPGDALWLVGGCCTP
jgi:hypothetical protein